MFLPIKLVYSIMFLSFYCVQASQKIDDIIIVRGVMCGGDNKEEYLQFMEDEDRENARSFCLSKFDLGKSISVFDENEKIATAIVLNKKKQYVGVIFLDFAAKILKERWCPGPEYLIDPQRVPLFNMASQVNFFSPIELCDMASDLNVLRKEELKWSVKNIPFERTVNKIDEIIIIKKYDSYCHKVENQNNFLLPGNGTTGYDIFKSSQNKRFFIPPENLREIIECFDGGKLPMVVTSTTNRNQLIGLIFTYKALENIALCYKKKQFEPCQENCEPFSKEDCACDSFIVLKDYSIDRFCILLPYQDFSKFIKIVSR